MYDSSRLKARSHLRLIPIMLLLLSWGGPGLRAANKDLRIKMHPYPATLVDPPGHGAVNDQTTPGILGVLDQIMKQQHSQRRSQDIHIPAPSLAAYRFFIPAGPTPAMKDPRMMPLDFSGEVTVMRDGDARQQSWSVEGVRAKDVVASLEIRMPDHFGQDLSLAMDGPGATARAGKPMVSVQVTGPYHLSVKDPQVKRIGWGVGDRERVYEPFRELEGGHWYSVENRGTGMNGTPRQKSQWLFFPYQGESEFIVDLVNEGPGPGFIEAAVWNGEFVSRGPTFQLESRFHYQTYIIKCLAIGSPEIEFFPRK